jgi:hypothetical protein
MGKRITLPLVPLPFPANGIDLQQGFGVQRPGTTREGINVYGFEPLTDRGRGGSRPGLIHIDAGQVPAGPHLIQELNIVVNGDVGFLLDSEDPPGPWVIDPSSPGPSSTWPPGIYYWDPNSGTTATWAPLQARVPTKKRRKGGSGIAPGKAVSPSSGNCVLGFYSCIGQLALTGGTLGGTNPAFTVHGCYINATLLAALTLLTGVPLGFAGPPPTAEGFRNWSCQVQKFYNDHTTPGNPAWTSSVYTGTTFVSPGDWVANPAIVPRNCTTREMSPPILITYGQRGSILLGCVNGTGQDSAENTCTGLGFSGNPDSTSYTYP